MPTDGTPPEPAHPTQTAAGARSSPPLTGAGRDPLPPYAPSTHERTHRLGEMLEPCDVAGLDWGPLG